MIMNVFQKWVVVVWGCASFVRTNLNQSSVQTGGSCYWWEKSGYSLGDQASVLTAERWGKPMCSADTSSALVLQVGFARTAVAHRNVVGEGTR